MGLMSSRENQKITDCIVCEIMEFSWRKMDRGKGVRRGGSKEVRASPWALVRSSPDRISSKWEPPGLGTCVSCWRNSRGVGVLGAGARERTGNLVASVRTLAFSLSEMKVIEKC